MKGNIHLTKLQILKSCQELQTSQYPRLPDTSHLTFSPFPLHTHVFGDIISCRENAKNPTHPLAWPLVPEAVRQVPIERHPLGLALSSLCPMSDNVEYVPHEVAQWAVGEFLEVLLQGEPAGV